MSITVKSLKDISMDQVHGTWSEAFSDYQVKITLSIEQLTSFFKQNDVSFDISVGAFDGEKMVGLWLNGLRETGGLRLAYDSGTAICPDYRGSGTSKKMAAKSSELLKKIEVSEYFLEVFCNNEKAYKVYLKDGFKVTRKLYCYMVSSAQFAENYNCGDIAFNEIAVSSELMGSLPEMEYRPSWQNANRAVLNIADEIRAVTAEKEGRIIGYGFVQKSRGRIPQIALNSEYWGTDAASMLLKKLCSICENGDVGIINIDENAKNTISLFEKHGFERKIESYEMKKIL